MKETENPENKKTGEEKKREEKKRANNQIMSSLSLFSNLCITMPLCVVIGFFIGKFFDNLLSTRPIFLLIFSALGVVASYTTLYKAGKK